MSRIAAKDDNPYGVPCRAFDPWMRVFDERGIDRDEFFRSLGIEPDYVEDGDNKISWNTWVEAVERFEARLGGVGGFQRHFRLGNRFADIPSMRVLTGVVGLFASPVFIFRVLWRWFGPSMFPGVRAQLEQIDRNTLLGTIEIPHDWRDSAAFFRLNRAAMMDTPMLVGAKPADIDLAIESHKGTYEIHLPKSGSVVSRVGRAFRAMFSANQVLDELENQNRRIVEGYKQLKEANRQLRSKQRQLERSARNFRTLIERSTEAIAVIADTELIYVNEAMIRFLEYDDESDLLGKSIDNILADSDAFSVEAPWGAEVENPFDPAKDVRFETRDAEIVRGDVNRLEIEFEGRPSTVLISRDVTKRREMAARMMQMDRMIAVGTLAAGVAHEINNPLTYVVTNTDFSLKVLSDLRGQIDELGVDDERLDGIVDKLDLIEESLEDSMHGGNRVKSIVRDLQTFSRRDETSTHRVDVNEVVSNAVKMGWHKIKSRARLVQNLSASATLNVDSSRLGQVVLNLLVNAAQAIPEGSANANTIWLKTLERDGTVVIEVKDTGSGISDEDMDRIFDPFFTTKPVGEGTGLGLSICKNLIEEMGGSLHIESEVGEGTRVEVTLPKSSDMDELDEQSEAGVDLARLANRRVLVVDDDPMIGVSVARLLSGASEVTSVQSAQAAIDWLEDETADILLCDVLMPQTNGIELLEILEERFPEAADRLIFMTGGAFSSDVDESLRQTQKSVLTKPFSLPDLVDACEQVLDD
jgi:PAS domain S-box-containing protein